MDNTLVCIPTYNESENIPRLVERIFTLYPRITVLIVDDNSPDGTSAVVTSLQSRYPGLRLLNRAGRVKGFANSYKDGFALALKEGFQWILQMDADFSHDPLHIAEMFRVRENYDLVVGSRYTKGGRVENWPLKRRVLSRGGNLYARTWLSSGLRDMTGGFNMWRAEALRHLKFEEMQTDGYSFLIEIKFHAARARLRSIEIPITFVDRTAAKSKMSSSIFREAVIAVPMLRLSNAPQYVPFQRSSPQAEVRGPEKDLAVGM